MGNCDIDKVLDCFIVDESLSDRMEKGETVEAYGFLSTLRAVRCEENLVKVQKWKKAQNNAEEASSSQWMGLLACRTKTGGADYDYEIVARHLGKEVGAEYRFYIEVERELRGKTMFLKEHDIGFQSFSHPEAPCKLLRLRVALA